MNCFLQFIFTTLLLLYVVYLPVKCDLCAKDNFISRLTIDSLRNDSGQWTAQVEFIHVDGTEQRGEWTSNIHQRTSNCENNITASENSTNGFVAVDATVLGPREDEAGAPTRMPHFDSLRMQLDNGSEALVSLSRGARRWHEARRACRARGGDLLDDVVGAARPAQRLLAQRRLDGRAFVGWRRNPEADERFETLAGDPVRQSDFVHWAPGRPSMSSSEEPRDACVSLAVESLLYDVPCDDPLPFFCLRVQSPGW
ncbi:hypothetical protein R5R35_005165 [Gryllus longicercus]|uniref:C-type lectin domain-containing protein n=1 Tax=Gryllus longicercus TaxID=2509291 RepID=A0AAN9V7E2_9ORTH